MKKRPPRGSGRSRTVGKMLFSVRLSPERARWLERTCVREKASRAEIIRRALDLYAQQQKGKS